MEMKVGAADVSVGEMVGGEKVGRKGRKRVWGREEGKEGGEGEP